MVSDTPARKAAGRKPAARRPADRPAPPADGIVRVQRETKGRRGKTVTVISGLPGGERDLEALLKALKQHCGAGGARDGAVLELQGDHRDRVLARLEALGHRVRLAGG
ncbi:MAG: hypothetical protein GEU80_04905 [Dehalococcoidia bacterium]|nr:hypothetical protein [Dehalococcoidia bacterium]